MADDPFSSFPNWNDPAYRRYWLKHNLSSEIWNDYSGDDIWRALASNDRYVSKNMLYEVRKYILANDERVQAFDNLDGENTIPYAMHEYEPYWSMTSKFLYTLDLITTNDDGDEVIIKRALGFNRQMTPNEIYAYAYERFRDYPPEAAIEFENIYITHAYRK